MSTALVIYGAIIVLITFGPLFFTPAPHTGAHSRSRAAEAHALTTPGINYAGNPYRIGAYVYVQEDSAPGSFDWQGTFLGMRDGMALVRDIDSGTTVHVNRDQLYLATR